MSNLFIGNAPAPGHQSPPGWIWLKPVECGIELYSYIGGEWVKQTTISYDTHSHSTHGDINFIGTLSADGDAGLTGQRTIAGYVLTFKKGLLVGFQAP